MYFPRHVAYDNVALIINPDEKTDYWVHRDRILKEPTNECKGCIFLENSMSLNDQKVRKCILHSPKYNSEITEKPIDCVFLSCDFNKRTKRMTQEETHKYFSLLSKYYGERKDVQQ